MAAALYETGWGYDARGRRVFGVLPDGCCDFITTPELSPLLGAARARQVAQAQQASVSQDICEFGAGALAAPGPKLLSLRPHRVNLSATLREHQQPLHGAGPAAVGNAQGLPTGLEMGELFTVIGFARGEGFDPLGFTAGDRTHTL